MSSEECISLIKTIEDSSLTLMCPSISTVTFYKGVPPLDFLRRKVLELIEKNPWLCGRLRKVPSGRGGGLELTFDSSSINLDEYFQVHHNGSLSHDLPYDDLLKHLLPMQVKTGNETIDKQKERLFIVSVIVINHDCYALLFSLSHVIGDGFTHYKLYGMLDENTPADALDAIRCQGYVEEVERHYGGDNDTFKYFFSPGVTFNFLKTLFFRPTCASRIHIIDQEWVSSEKKRFSSDPDRPVDFISTNDILTSWYLKFIGCDFAGMAMNLRGRLKGVTEQMAGNYEVMVGYQREDVQEPVYIRQSLPGWKRTRSGRYPGLFESLFIKNQHAILSSWVTFYSDVRLPNSKQRIHLPCVENVNMVTEDLSVLFRPNKGELALLSFSRGKRTEQLDHEAPLKELLLPPSRPVQPSLLGVLAKVALTTGVGAGLAIAVHWYLHKK